MWEFIGLLQRKEKEFRPIRWYEFSFFYNRRITKLHNLLKSVLNELEHLVHIPLETSNLLQFGDTLHGEKITKPIYGIGVADIHINNCVIQVKPRRNGITLYDTERVAITNNVVKSPKAVALKFGNVK